MSRGQIQDRLAALRAQVHFGGDAGVAVASITAVRETFPEVIALVGRLLREASYPDSEVEELKRQTLAAIEAQRTEPRALVANTLARHGNPYPRGDVRHARTFDQIVEDVRAVTPEKLRRFHDRFYGAGHAQFGASGDMDADAVRQALQQAFGGWSSAVPYVRIPTPLVPAEPARFVIRTPDKPNASFAAVLPLAMSDEHPDYPAFMLANRILGQDSGSRLWTRLREKEGLSYDARSGVAWNSREPNSPWQASAIYAPQARAKVEQAFDEVLARALAEGFTRQELEQAKNGLLALRRLGRSQDANLAAALASNLDLGRSFALSQRVDEAIAAATLDEVDAALRRHLDPKRLVTAFGGDFPAP